MNKQELIEKYKELENSSFDIAAIVVCQLVLKDLEQLDEPKPVKVKQFVADWYEENKDSFEFNVWDWIAFRCEIDKFARESYKAIHNTKGEIELHDITAVSDESIRGIGSVDIICGGFPCQAFSIAGNRRGFEDTRGTLFFEIARFASILRPKYLFLENVKGLLNHENGVTFETIISTLDELGYNVEWQVLNSKNFGVPQNRERVFIIGHSRKRGTRRVFPMGQN